MMNFTGSRTQNFTYDSLNRLTSAQNQARWSNVYTYDAWGNLTKNLYGGTSHGEYLDTSATAQNWMPGYYDVAGNSLTDGINNWNYVYDGKNRITTAGSVTYTYDADGQRIQKSSGTDYCYGPGGQAYDPQALNLYSYVRNQLSTGFIRIDIVSRPRKRLMLQLY